jgi:two-component system sensor histidine kinase RegB
MWLFRPIPAMHLPMGSGFALHILGMWIGFILSVLLIAHFLSSMAANVRARDQALARAREQALRDERLISLGTLAASAAHELGTPLGTLAVLTEELAADVDEQAREAAHRKLALMDGQIERCKQAIAGIASSAGIESAQGGHAQEVAAFIDTIVSEWRGRRAGIQVHCQMNGAAPGPRLLAEKSLASALTNIFDNAADASPANVDIQAEWDDDALAIRVSDRGHGFAPEQRARVGRTLFTGKADGHGLGLYLSHGIIDRLGGKLSIRPRAGGGTAVEVRLPLAGLKV